VGIALDAETLKQPDGLLIALDKRVGLAAADGRDSRCHDDLSRWNG
jgi:hypothetical protein